MPGLATDVQSISAGVPYLRSDLDKLFVEYTARILSEDTLDRRAVQIRNGRTAPRPPSLDREGFQIATLPSRVIQERFDELTSDRTPLQVSPVQRAYWDETVPLIRELSGAREVHPVHASTVRFSPRAQRTQRMTPAGWVHLDYDPDEAQVQLRETLELHGCTPKPFSRCVLYQSWRVLSDPPQDFPLAICDGRTVDARDIVPIEYHLKSEERDVTYRSRGARFNARHEWWYYPDMTSQEMLLFKGYDSDEGDRLKTLHVAFEDPTATAPVPRVSLETRYFALFD